jgi:hypothetical protein
MKRRLLGEKGYDSAELREDLHECGTKPVQTNEQLIDTLV